MRKEVEVGIRIKEDGRKLTKRNERKVDASITAMGTAGQ